MTLSAVFSKPQNKTRARLAHTHTLQIILCSLGATDVIKCYEVWTYEIQSIWLQPVVLVVAVVVVAVAVVVAFDDDDARDQLKNKQNSKHNTCRTHRGTGQGRYG